MQPLEGVILFLKVAAVALLIGAAAIYRDHVYELGYEAAVAAGEAELKRATAAARQTETTLRAQLHARDTAALRKEQDHATSLEAAQRRVRAGTDRLRCPVGPVPGPAAPIDRPAAGGAASDGEGPDLVPEVAAEILGDGAAIAGIVRRYERLEQRFEACRALNAGP